MKTISSIGLCWLVLTALLLQAGAQTFRTDINPALLYYQAFSLAPDLDAADRDFLWNTNYWRNQELPKRYGELMAQYDAQFRLVRQAAHATVPCDWGIDMTLGPATLMPQYARAKAVAQAARMRVLWELQQGQPEEAYQDILATVALGRNLTTDGTLISFLVDLAMEAMMCSSMEENFGRFSPEVLQRLVSGWEALPARPTAAAALASDKALYWDASLRKLQELRQQYPGNEAQVLEGLRQYLGLTQNEADQPELWKKFVQAAGGTSQGMLNLLQDREKLFERFIPFLNLPYADYQSQVKALEQQYENSSNPYIAEAFPSMLKARRREFRVLVDVAMVHAAVAYKLHGQAGLQTVPDPCGQGPFGFQRFTFQGVDRGFELKSVLDAGGFQEVGIFVEKRQGPPFRSNGPYAGQAYKE
jgi:hypothetical protein